MTVLGIIAQKMRISLEWLIMGTGQMYRDETIADPLPPLCEGEDMEKPDSRKKKGDEMADMSAIPHPSLPTQPIENVSSPIQNMADMSAIAPSLYEENRRLYQKNMELQERLLKVSEDKAELQVALERATMNVERRDMRIRELEEENARLREARKGPAPVFRAITGEAN